MEVDPYIVASRFATYTPFFNLNYFALAAKEHQRLMTIADTIPHYGNDSNLLIVFYVQIMPDDFVMQLHRF